MVKKYSRRYLLTHLRYIQFFSSSSDNRLKKPPRNSKFTKTKLIHRSSIVPRKEKKTKDRNKGIFVCGRGNEVDLICTAASSSSWQLQVARCARIWKYSVYPPYRAGDPRERERERERECVSLATINARHFSTSSCVNNTARILRGISHSFRRPTPISLRARLSEGEETRERMPRACNVSSPEKGTSTYREFNPRRERRLMDRRLFFRVIVGNRTVFLFFISPLGDSLPPGIIGISSFVK